MNISDSELLSRTAASIPAFLPIALQSIEKGGSSRRFFRLHSKNGDSAILVHDLGEKEENRHYATLAHFLERHGIPVPKVLAVEHSAGLLWLEDLGTQDLWASRTEEWAIRRPLYESALRGAARLHWIPLNDARELHLQKAFDEQLYRWEQEYFAEHCLGGIFGISKSIRTKLLESSALLNLAHQLAARPRQLIHRDFQSQNIMIAGGGAVFIDFQGMRPGLAQYDLASLLCDPYVAMAPEEREELLAFYRSIPDASDHAQANDFEKVFWQCAAQRLMQALGAYGFLSIHCGKPAFRAHVAPAMRNLREVLNSLDPHDQLHELASLIKHF